MAKLATIPGRSRSPQVTLHRLLERLDDIKGVVVLVQWQDDTFTTHWSTLRVDALCMAATVLQRQATLAATGEGDDCEYLAPAG